MSRIGATNERHKGRTMGGGKRTPEQREVDLSFCADLFVKGYTYQQIEQELRENISQRGLNYSVSYVQIYKDIKKLLVTWKKERFDVIDDYVTAELRKLDRMEQELWEAWEASKEGKRKTKIAGGSIDGGNITGGQLKERNLETTHGNPQYMTLILNVQQRRAKLLGYDAPTKLDIHRPDNPFAKDETDYSLESLPEELLEKMAEAMMRNTSNKLNKQSQTPIE